MRFNMMPCALETPTSEMRWNWSNLKTRLCMYMLSKWGANQNKALCICSLLGRIWLNEIWTLRITKSLRARAGREGENSNFVRSVTWNIKFPVKLVLQALHHWFKGPSWSHPSTISSLRLRVTYISFPNERQGVWLWFNNPWSHGDVCSRVWHKDEHEHCFTWALVSQN